MNYYTYLFCILSAFGTSLAEQKKLKHAVKLGEPVHFECVLPETFSKYIFAIFRLKRKGEILSTCNAVVRDGGSQCYKSNDTDKTVKWAILHDRSILDAVEAIKLVTSPMDAGIYSCNLELFPKSANPGCPDDCQNESPTTSSELEIIPPLYPIPMINHKIFMQAEFRVTLPDILVGCFFSVADKNNIMISISHLDVSIEPNELFDLPKNDTYYDLKCCIREQCISVKLSFNETSPSKKFYLPVRNLQFGGVIEKSARIIHKRKGDICGSAPTHAKFKLPSVGLLFEIFNAVAAIVMLAASLAAALVIVMLTA